MTGTNGTNGVNGHNDTSEQLPSAQAFSLSPAIRIQPPLTRRGHGPALILLVPDDLDLNRSEKTLDPPPLQKWAEEGYAVAQIALGRGGSGKLRARFEEAVDELKKLGECDSVERLGIIAYNVPDVDEVSGIVETLDIAGIITYGASALKSSKPQLSHQPQTATNAVPTTNGKSQHQQSLKTFSYPDIAPHFAIPSHSDFSSSPASVAHTRSLSFLKPLTHGPWFDLEAIWDEHCKYEFGERAVEKTMATMVQEPYVNHIPTMTGGIGRERLTNFYRHHFIFSNPDDTALELVSRTVGIDRVIDEFVFKFTHDREIPWLAPGIPPTGQHCELPFTSVVNVRGDRLYHEHIGWDQATLLRQLGLMPEYLHFPYPVNGKEPAAGKAFEYRVPTAGKDITRKLVDERSVESNGMFQFAVREVDRS